MDVKREQALFLSTSGAMKRKGRNYEKEIFEDSCQTAAEGLRPPLAVAEAKK